MQIVSKLLFYVFCQKSLGFVPIQNDRNLSAFYITRTIIPTDFDVTASRFKIPSRVLHLIPPVKYCIPVLAGHN